MVAYFPFALRLDSLVSDIRSRLSCWQSKTLFYSEQQIAHGCGSRTHAPRLPAIRARTKHSIPYHIFLDILSENRNEKWRIKSLVTAAKVEREQKHSAPRRIVHFSIWIRHIIEYCVTAFTRHCLDCKIYLFLFYIFGYVLLASSESKRTQPGDKRGGFIASSAARTETIERNLNKIKWTNERTAKTIRTYVQYMNGTYYMYHIECVCACVCVTP